jgi:hypothetical protein
MRGVVLARAQQGEFMRRNSWWFLGVCALLSGVTASLAHAQQLKPYFLVIVDTSGSMGWCAGGSSTQNGINDCSCLNTAACTCLQTNSCVDSNFKTNRCGFPANKLGDAKCALQRILDGVGGDATFGLMQFDHPCSDTCAPTTSQCTGLTGSCTTCNDGQVAVEISSGNANLMREWVDGQCQGSCGLNNFRHELTLGQWTPLARSLERANEYLRGNSASVPFATGASGLSAPLNNDRQLACRPVSVILLTDGDDTCVGDAMKTTAPPAAAGALNMGDPRADNSSGKAFRTYVIGFGSSGGNFSPAVLDDIATQGGTDSRDGSGHKYYSATNEEQLSLALTRIIADAQPPQEICNNKDDDCDGNSDEGLPKFCNKPAGQIDPTLCDEPKETNCDGQDDDCDGIIDEGLTNACGACGDVPKEVCDKVDNDCDSRVDEDTNGTEACGADKGECKAGQLVCTDGAEMCRGEIGPSQELCDCKDNDCDGMTDESNPSSICPDGQRCAGCRCVDFCRRTTEFTPECPNGLTPEFQANGECLCITDTCDHDGCPKATMMNDDGTPSCAPKSSRVAACQCKAGTCVAACSGVTCSSGDTCDPRSGRCVEDNCRGLGCASMELCDPSSGRCIKDECASASCASDQVCRAGKCEASCAAVSCAKGQSCKSGECQTDACASVSCARGQVCKAESGECADDVCITLQCARGQTCSQSSGRCETDPCWTVKCPSGQTCVNGDCHMGGSDEGVGSRSDSLQSAPSRLVATGGGGCACSVPGQPKPNGEGSEPLRALGLLLAGLVFLRWRRRSGRTVLALGLCVLAGSSVLSGCRVSPICINCNDAGSSPTGQQSEPQTTDDKGNASNPKPDAGDDIAVGSGGSGQSNNGAAGGAAGSGSTMPNTMKCVATGPETCNNKDDDCDFKVDEDAAPTQNDCNQLGVCAGTKPVCMNGMFTCRYSDKYEATEKTCDGLDNDCNGKVDEAFPTLGQPCEVGVGACKTTGTLKCNSSGKGLACDATPSHAKDEVCNGKDDDCDGVVDEPKGQPGTNPSYVKDDVVQVRSDLWIYKYEASRVDADDSKQGIVAARSCSRAGVLPWTNVTYTEAYDACKSVDMTLCNLDGWVFACESGSAQCGWSIANSCTDYSNGSCNGHNASTNAGDADSDALHVTGGQNTCYADFGADGRVYDLSGNAKEWTTGSQSPDTNPLRGGSYNNSADGLRCDFDFAYGAKDLRLPNIGFRCCSNSAP